MGHSQLVATAERSPEEDLLSLNSVFSHQSVKVAHLVPPGSHPHTVMSSSPASLHEVKN